jgi:polyphosphate kinase 2 (PPK2 family)
MAGCGDALGLGTIYTGNHKSHEDAAPEILKHVERMDKLQYLLYADGNQSLLVVLQALDAAGKDGVIRHVFSGMNPEGHRSSASSSRAKSRPPTISSGAPTSTRQAKAKW